MPRIYSLAILALFLPTLTPAALSSRQAEVKEVQRLQSLDHQCAKFNRSACQKELSSLAKMCKNTNSFACFRLGEIASINSEIAAKRNKRNDAVRWLDIALGSTKKACALKLPQACTQLKDFKRDFDKNCKKGDQFFCRAFKNI